KKIEKVQKILMENESKYRMLIQTIPDIVYSLNKNGIITFVNEAVKQLGYSPTDLIGKHFSDILHPEDVEKASSAHVLKKYRGEKTGDENSPKLFDERRTRDRKTANLEVRFLSRLTGAKTGLIGTTTQVNSSGLYDKQAKEVDKNF
ncbi:MAG: PAS domain S-box protein, partial [Calditrichia bacterium]|nr:PAS domain S-box protein [Calditrichia bacterium]